MKFFGAVLSMILFCALATSATAYITRIYAPAVLENLNKGSLTLVQLNVTGGSGGVQVNGPASVDSSTLSSASTAASIAAGYLGLKQTSYNFNYTIFDKNVSVSGPSAGLALTLLAVAGLQHKQLVQNFTVTGTISSNGGVGLIGGAYDKAGAAKRGGMKYIIVPYSSGSSFEHLLYYMAQQAWNITVVEAANVSQALPYALSGSAPPQLAINLTQNYNLNLGNANVTCNACNISAFGALANFTFNFSSGAIANISSRFGAAKQQLTNNLGAYRALAAKGYLYTGADFAYLDFLDSFVLSNLQNFNSSRAIALLAGIGSYCSSIAAPQLTDANYEYVVGGSLRLYLANITLGNAQALLNSEQTTDDIIQSVYNAAPAVGWCNAASESFSIASSLGGNPVSLSSSVKSAAAQAINRARSYAGSIYLRSALRAYNASDYATALYAATYASVFGPTSLTSGLSGAQISASTLANIRNSTFGIWPTEFADQAEFYWRQSILTQGAASTSNAAQAYGTALLAKSLAADNLAITNSFTIAGAAPASLQSSINGIQQNISQIYSLLLVNAVLLFAILVALLIHILPKKTRRGVR